VGNRRRELPPAEHEELLRTAVQDIGTIIAEVRKTGDLEDVRAAGLFQDRLAWWGHDATGRPMIFGVSR
jgi:hypothetical protein